MQTWRDGHRLLFLFCGWCITTQLTICAAGEQSAGHMCSAFAAGLRPRLDAIDRIRGLLSDVTGDSLYGIDLPSIVVVGDQNSGKSSVLESLSGVALPRSDGLVTRVPLVLKLRRAEHTSAVLSYFDEGKQKPYVYVFADLSEVSSEILKATKVLAGTKSGLGEGAITLEINTPEAPDLTMVDLPGIVRNPIGNQPKDIEDRIRKLILSYIEGDSKIVLCILPATADFATQEAIKLARLVDPHGQRTLGVVTKSDLATWGLRARLEATGENHLRMELGYVAVRCRSQEELNEGTSSEEMRQRERDFFQNHAELSHLPDEYKGMPALVDKLVKLQGQRIHSHLPVLKKQVEAQLLATKQELESTQGVIQAPADAENVLSGLLDKMHRRFEGLVKGDYAVGDHDLKRIHVAPRVHKMLETYKDQAWEDIGGKDFFFTSKCHHLLRQHSKEVSGTSLPNLLGDRVFKLVYTQAVYSNMHPAAMGLADSIHLYLAEVLTVLTDDAFSAFPRLGAEVHLQGQGELTDLAANAKASVQANLDGEGHMFTNNGDYLASVYSLRRDVMNQNSSFKASDKGSKSGWMDWGSKAQEDNADMATKICLANNMDGDEVTLEVLDGDETLVHLQLSLAAYTQIVMRSLCDTVPKLVYNQLVTKMATSLQNRLRQRLREDEQNILGLMHDPQRAARHHKLEKKLATLRKASQELRHI